MTAEPARALSVRFPTFDDGARLGLLISAGLADAPSAPLDRDELGQDLEQVGRDFVSAHVFGSETLIIAELGRHAVGLARIVPREFVRAAHIGTLQLLVAPTHRRQGVGRFLLDTALGEAFGRRNFERIEMPIADHDLGTARLVGPPRWTIERIERQSLQVFGDYHDVTVWVADR